MPMKNNKNKFYLLLFADDLCAFLCYKKGGKNVNSKIQMNLKSIEVWLNKWRLRMATTIVIISYFRLTTQGNINLT